MPIYSIRVLYIEDDPNQRALLSATLRRRGLTIDEAANGLDGLRLAGTGRQAVVLCDFHLPDMTGMEFLRHLRQQGSQAPVILITSRGSVTLAVEAIKAGAFHFAIKPIEPDDIETSIRRAVEADLLRRQVEKSEMQIAAIMDTVPDVIYSLGPEGEFLSINKACQAVLGYSPEEMIGTKVSQYVHPDDREAHLAGYLRTFENPASANMRFDLRMIARDGTVRHMEISRRLVFENGRAVRSDGVARDISEEVKLKKELEQHAERLEERVRERTVELEYANRQLGGLNEISARLATIVDENELFDVAPRLLTEFLDFDRAGLQLLDAEGQLVLRSISFRHDDPDRFERVRQMALDGEISFPPHFGRVIETNQTLHVGNVDDDPEWPKEVTQIFPVKDILVTPLRLAGKPVGIVVGNLQYHERQIDEQDIDRFETFASMVGMALERARGYQTLETAVIDRTQSLRDANQKLREKALQLEYSAIELGKANVELLTIKEMLEDKNAEMQRLLDELARRKDEMQAIFDTSGTAIIMANTRGRITTANSGIAQYFGIAEADVIGRSLSELLEQISGCFDRPETSRDTLARLLESPQKVLPGDIDSGLDEDYELELVRPMRRSVAVYVVPVVGRDGTVLGTVLVFADITAQKRAAEQLRTIVDVSPVPLIVTRPSDGTIIFANDRLAQVFGFDSADQVVGFQSPEFYADPEDRRRVIEMLTRDGRVDNMEALMNHRDGHTIWTTFSLVTTELAGEKVILGGVYDTTERRKAEEQLQRERNFVSAVLDTAGALVIVLRPDGTIIRFNRACEEITGYAAAEVEGRRFWDYFIMPEEVALIEERFSRIMQGPWPVTGENCWKTRTGERRLISWSNTAIFNEREGDIDYVVAIGIDITRQRSALDALEFSERRFRTLVENASDVICSFDERGNFTYVSPKIKDIAGYDPAEMIGQPATSMLHPDSVDRITQWIESGFESQDDDRDYEFKARHKDGSYRWLTANATMLRDENGHVREIISVLHDITDMRRMIDDLAQANRDLKDAQAQLVQSEKMASLGLLVAGIAHEINTPIGAVSSMHNTLVRAVEKIRVIIRQGKESGCEHCSKLLEIITLIDNANRVIENGSQRVITIVRRLRSFARLDEAELKDVDIHECIEDTLLLIHHEIKNRITVVREFGELPRVDCYPGKLNQVLLNILNNSRQAIADNGEITIRTWLSDTSVNVSIRDTGAGIRPEHLAKIFDPGFTTKGVGVGTGLGLSICYQIMREHRGDIRVTSTLGQGTTFSLSIPLHLKRLLEQEGAGRNHGLGR